jgi:hypothetical protein
MRVDNFFRTLISVSQSKIDGKAVEGNLVAKIFATLPA